MGDAPISRRHIMRRFFRILAKGIVGLLVLLIAVVVILGLVGFKADMSHLRPGIEIAASTALGREVRIAGPVEVEFSNWPELEVTNITISNTPDATQPQFFIAGLARMRIGVFPLLRGEINIAEITAEEVTLNLESDAQGNPNWVFDRPETVKNEGLTETADDDSLITFTALDYLSLKQIAVTYHDAALNKSLSFVLQSMEGTAAKDEPLIMNLAGTLQDKTYDLELKGGPIASLLDAEKPWAFEVNGEIIGKTIASKGDMMLRGKHSVINLALGLRQVDVGKMLSTLGLVEGMQAQLGDMDMKLSISGESLQEILRQSGMRFTVKDGSWKVRMPHSDTTFDIHELSGDILVEKGNNITMELEGVVDATPVKLLITGAPLVEYVVNQEEIPLKIDAELAKSRFSLASNVKLPLTLHDITLAFNVSSERIDHLNPLFRLDLPPIGPVLLESKLKVNKAGYDLSKLNIRVGDSRLNGKMKLSAGQPKRKLNISLISESIQLDDFDTGKPEQTEKQVPQDKAKVDQQREEKTETTSEAGGRSLLSYEVLGAFDADIKIEARDVRSGKDKLGSALMRMNLNDGKLAVEPLRVNIPGGGIQVVTDYTPSPTGVDFNIKANIEDFDIGVMARRAKPGTNMGGNLKLEGILHSQAPDPASLMQHANGNLDFALVPQNFSAGIIDLWAVNLLSAIMDKSTEKDESEINCVVVRFGMQDGLMKEKAIYLDTSNMRIAGTSEIDFNTRRLAVRLAPKAKKPEFFSMAVPIQVKGKFDDFGFSVGGLRLAGQLVSFVTSPIHVPIKRIFTNDAPTDGVEACKAAWTKTAEDEVFPKGVATKQQ